MLKIAITGNIASGKSQVERILADMGFPVFDADKIAHSCLEKLESFYGYDVFTEGKIDRKKLGDLVFNNLELKQNLEEIIHPQVKQEIFNLFEKNVCEKLVFVSVPLLFEAEFDNLFDKIIIVTTKKETRLERLMKRNNLSKEEALLRINSQMNEKDKISKSDFVIVNDSTIEELKNQVDKFLTVLK